MAIPFKRVYRMRLDGTSAWSIVMGLTPLPGLKGLWMARASLTHPATTVEGKVFEGDDGKLVVVDSDARHIFEPLTLETWRDMGSQVSGYDELSRALTSEAMLQGWYWDEFAHDGEGNEINQGTILDNLSPPK